MLPTAKESGVVKIVIELMAENDRQTLISACTTTPLLLNLLSIVLYVVVFE